MLTKIKFEKFTVFKKAEINLSPGINIFIGENGTGKTHVLKAAYAACDISKTKSGFAEKVNNVFFPSGKQIGRLVHRSSVSSKGSFEVQRTIEGEKAITLRLSMSNHTTVPEKATVSGSTREWMEKPIEAVYIPVKDMMANAKGFSALYKQREVHFEEIYVDIVEKASLPQLKGPTDGPRKKLLQILQDSIDGKVVQKEGEFFLRNKHGELEFTLLAEGYRKLGLLWTLIQNGTLRDSTVLFWDEPETNLNPKLMGTVIKILLELQRVGVQIFISTHDYVVLKQFDLQKKKHDKLLFHSLFRGKESGLVEHHSSSSFLEIAPNAIDDAFGELVQAELRRSVGGVE